MVGAQEVLTGLGSQDPWGLEWRFLLKTHTREWGGVVSQRKSLLPEGGKWMLYVKQ